MSNLALSPPTVRPPAIRSRSERLAAVAGPLSMVLTVAATAIGAVDVGEALTRNTIRLSLAWYATAILLMMRLDHGGWECQSSAGRLARWCWTWGIVGFLIHLGMAFHYYHNWSPADAFERTRRISGAGEGIYVSYLFTWIWLFDAALWQLAPLRYARRPNALGTLLHAFMLFIVFNGTIVYETGPIRWVGIAMCTAFVVTLIQRKNRGFGRKAT